MDTLKGEKHFTSSVWLITNKTPKKVLLVFHKKFNLWIQPGGHIEKFEDPVKAAIRETLEETGIDISFLNDKIIDFKDAKSLPLPDFILEERVPKFKNEPEHFHIDIMYVVKIDELEFKENKKETNGIAFFTKKEALKLPLHEDSKYIIQKVLS